MPEIQSSIRETTRGGQVFLHTLHMYGQILKTMTQITAVVFILFNLAWFFCANSNSNIYLFFKNISAQAHMIFDKNALVEYRNGVGQTYKVYAKSIVSSPEIQSKVVDVKVMSTLGFGISLVFCFVFFIGSGIYFRQKGKEVLRDKNVNGHSVVNANELNKMLKRDKKLSPLKIGDLHLLKGSETRHTLMHGTNGSGKSEVIKNLISQIINRGDKFIVFDKSCDLANEFYNPNRHVLLNVFDKRCPGWNVWSDARDQADLASMAEALIPPSASESAFFIRAARKVFECTAAIMQKEADKSSIKLMRKLLTAELSTIHDYLKDTEAATLVDLTAEKTSSNIKSEMATYLSSLKYLHDEGEEFSIRDFVSDKSDKQGVFITSLSDKHLVIKPLITLWLDIAMNAIMSLEKDESRRIWIILDEWHSLHNLPILPTAANEIRKFGGCLVLGTTSYANIRHLYGRDCAQAIFGQINTSVFFTSPEYETNVWASNQLGESEIEEVVEGYSYGAHPMRDGVSVNTRRVRRPAVTTTDLERLPDYQAYVKIAGHYPIAHLKFKKNNFSGIKEPGFIQREINEGAISDVVALEEKYTKKDFVNNTTKSVEKKEEVLIKESKPKVKKKGGSMPEPTESEDNVDKVWL